MLAVHLQELPQSCEAFLAEHLRRWDGFSHQESTFALVPYLKAPQLEGEYQHSPQISPDQAKSSPQSSNRNSSNRFQNCRGRWKLAGSRVASNLYLL